jgi:hypothetical protein
MSDLRTAIGEMTDEALLSALRTTNDYTEDALSIIREEIERRGLSVDAAGTDKDEGEVRPIKLNAKDFLPFDHSFSKTDLIIARAMLQENTIPFFEDNPSSTPTLPIESETELLYTIHVHKEYAEKAHTILDEHFLKVDNRYLLKYSGARDRLKAFNFSDIRLSEKEAAVEAEVDFSDEEKNCIISLGQRLLSEADAIEQKQERVLFYYDSIEPIIERLGDNKELSLSLSDLLTILEILQVYADDPALPATMDEAISQLLSFFLKS